MSNLSLSQNPAGYIGFLLVAVITILIVDPIESALMTALFDSVFSISDIMAGLVPADSGFSSSLWMVPFLKGCAFFLYNLSEALFLYGLIVAGIRGLFR